MNNQLPERIRLMNDQQWLELLIQSIEKRDIGGVIGVNYSFP
jgi:hypothetical protein